MVKGGYVNAALPSDLARRIDQHVKQGDLGYRSRQEFVTDAVRQLLLRLEERTRSPPRKPD